MTALVLLHGATEGPDRWASTTSGLPADLRVLTPALAVDPTSTAPFTLETGTAAVAAVLDAAGLASATVCGLGLGALVALRLAADAPSRVDGLVLITRQVRLNPILMSLPAAVLRLVPATTAQRLGVEPRQVLALLDQVRPVDASPLARRTQAPALVLCGARDRLNRRASQSLARSLPYGRLELLPGAAPDWPTAAPTLLTNALTTFLTHPR